MIFKFIKKKWNDYFNKESSEFNEDYIQVEPTQEGIESNQLDEFNKQIVIYRDGKRNRIIDYSPEDLKALRVVHPELPLFVEKIEGDYEIVEGEYFGEVVTG